MSTLIDRRQEQLEQALEGLQEAYENSAYTICGAGGELSDWVNGVNGLMADRGIGEPLTYEAFTGEQLNEFAADGTRHMISHRDAFPSDLTILVIRNEGLHMGKLAMLKLQLEDRWMDDIVDNMRRPAALRDVG